MCGLAELLHNMGAVVTGSDLAENANTQRLQKLGVTVYFGHKAEQVGDSDVVVYSSAINPANPEIAQARAKRIPLIPRAEALSEIMRLKRGIAVAGTHGKTTTTSLISSIFLQADLSPTIFLGGRFELINSTALLGQGDWLIAEADESDGSFHKLSPEISVITNIDSDHLDHFKTFENLQKSFHDFALKIPFYGSIVVCGDDAIVRQVFQNFPKRILTYGFNEGNDYRIQGEKGRYDLYHQDKKLGSFDLNVPGRHNALNACAAIIVALEAGISFENCQKGLRAYHGVDRRFQFKGEKKNIKVYDDYGHHPTEVKATLAAFREKFPDSRIVIYFQPHRYSRTQSCWYEFTQCFAQCDKLFLTDIYPAGESPIDGIHSDKLLTEIKLSDKTYLKKSPEMVQLILSELKSGDVFVTLGAGDGWKLGLEILEKI
jgi:UDP-N-acetylmuramate--alanine ligase